MSAICDITPFSLLDYPGIPAAIVWFGGCNLRCGYCYNPQIVYSKEQVEEERVISFLEKRIGLLEGVVLSGGEATLYGRMVEFARRIKALGYKIKLDTNAMRPDVVLRLAEERLLDYVALDYKTDRIGGWREETFWETFHILRLSGIEFEVRTTFHPDLMDDDELIETASKLAINGYAPLYVQRFRENVPTLGNMGSPIRQADYRRLKAFVSFRS